MPSLIECSDLKENVELCRELGLTFIELNIDLPMFQISELKKLTREPGIEHTLHLPEETNVWDFNPRVRDAYLHTVTDAVEVAQRLGIEIINMHMNPGVYFTLPDRRVYLFQEYRDEYLRATGTFMDMIGKHLERSGVKLCIENAGKFPPGFHRGRGRNLAETSAYIPDLGHRTRCFERESEQKLHDAQSPESGSRTPP